jgi:hypothetical protein
MKCVAHVDMMESQGSPTIPSLNGDKLLTSTLHSKSCITALLTPWHHVCSACCKQSSLIAWLAIARQPWDAVGLVGPHCAERMILGQPLT